MKSYGATFVAGCQDIILRQLKKFPINRLKVTYHDDSFISFDSDFPPEDYRIPILQQYLHDY